ncbi:AAA family ATPase [Mycolicibacterium sp. BiH015]|uniref:AAA family ATPase n=1 Tax=Mycolicibacterium sp. BiH015 TaxID=3018808 RepID=UPI0022E3ABED|nr:AAA family ATPase [Mycolicibacterium sp. BiH015]MDA2893395.1 AAA family ATPase [Mycolicibacterium sp. BiH015]
MLDRLAEWFARTPDPVVQAIPGVVSFFLGVLTYYIGRRIYLSARRRRLQKIASSPLRRVSLERLIELDDRKGKFATDEEWQTAQGPILVESINIRNFKSFERLDVYFEGESELTGHWACIAGTNGAGKSSILQAVCLILLGNELATDLGRGRLTRMSRRASDTVCDALITAVVRQGASRRWLALPFSDIGIDETALREHPDYNGMQLTWRKLRDQVLVSYGATRNLAPGKQTRSPLLPIVQRQLSLFEPLTEIASAAAILADADGSRDAMRLLERLVPLILTSDEIGVISGPPFTFERGDAVVEAIDLPDGFRSTMAWLADLCVAWHEAGKRKGRRPSTDPAEVTGIVLIDEIGLHLHPELERAIVPRLRRALPNVQFIVTTHSPMVLASFDRTELKVLDARSSTGMRPPLDRQVFGFTMDDVYEYLMGTAPSSSVVEELLEEGTSKRLAEYLYQSKDTNEVQAREALRKRQELIKKIDEKGKRER